MVLLQYGVAFVNPQQRLDKLMGGSNLRLLEKFKIVKKVFLT